jgi:hypothetical protein
MKQTLDAHPSVTIAYSSKGKLLMAVYDGGYPQVSYRFSANNIGGNPNPGKGELCPIVTLRREIADEFDPNHGEKNKFGQTVSWAEQSDIQYIRDSLLKNLVPHQDFLVKVKQFPFDPTTFTYDAIFSFFLSEVPQDVIEYAERNINNMPLNFCRRLSTEGLTGVFTLDQLANDPVKGNLSTAHATAPILNHYFGSRIPYPHELNAEPIGKVRESYQDYLSDFEYKPHAWKH